MLLLIGLLLMIVFFGLGFTADVLWLGILLGLVLVIADVVSGRRNL
jgi:hypothetical protein